MVYVAGLLPWQELYSLSWSCGRSGKVSFPLVDTAETFLLLCAVEQSLRGSREAVSFLLGDLPAAAFLCCFESIAAIPL